MNFKKVVGYHGNPMMINLDLLEAVAPAKVDSIELISLFMSGEEMYIRGSYKEFAAMIEEESN